MRHFSLLIIFSAMISICSSNCNAEENTVALRTPDLDRDFLHYTYEGVTFHYRINAQQTFAYLQDLDNWGTCYNYERIVVPDSLPYNGKNYPVQVIEYATFRGATKLKELVLPATVISLGTNWNMTPEIWPFSIISDYTDYCYCPNLEKITIAEKNPVMKDIDGVVYSKDGSILYYHPPKNSETYVIPEGVTPANYAFACNEVLKQVDFQNKVTKVSNASFYNCKNLRKIELPNSLESIGGESFYNCIKLHDINIPENLQSIENLAFEHCNSLGIIKLPDGFKKLGGGAFYDADIDTLYIPSTIDYIGGGSLCVNNSDFVLVMDVPSPSCFALEDEKNPFQTGVKPEWKLYVPLGSKNLYANARYWEGFKTILEGNPANVNQTEINKIKVIKIADTIKLLGIDRATPICIYNIKGFLYYKNIVSNDCDIQLSNINEQMPIIVTVGNQIYKFTI